ncbi:MAG: hypothetical protein KA368_10860 [Acidobacteria bacterium]|nr:hypothetical protein [Acidobacteriota bacterium]
MKRKMFFGLALTLLLAGFSAQAQKADEPLKAFEGAWTGSGKFFGMDATTQARWERLLGGKFLRLTISYEMKTPDGKAQKFEGIGYYQSKGGKYEGHWFDSQGNSYPLTATFESDTLTSLWGEPGKSEGKSTYRINAAEKTLEVVDATKQKDGSWKEFSRFKLAMSR